MTFLLKRLSAAAAGVFLAGTAMAETPADGTATQELWALMEPACNANGIDPDKCRCIMDAVVASHGVEATTLVALDMSLMYEEAEALRAKIGEDAGMNASIAFDQVQNGACANAPAPGSQDTGPASASSAAEGATTGD